MKRTLAERVSTIENKMELVYDPKIKEHDDILKHNAGGLKIATLLDSKATSTIVLAIIGAAVLYIGSRGGV